VGEAFHKIFICLDNLDACQVSFEPNHIMKLPVIGTIVGGATILAGLGGSHYFDRGWGGSTFHTGMSWSQIVEMFGIATLTISLIAVLGCALKRRF
jgi:hypothetical protein